jgi:hypothetical protein
MSDLEKCLISSDLIRSNLTGFALIWLSELFFRAPCENRFLLFVETQDRDNDWSQSRESGVMILPDRSIILNNDYNAVAKPSNVAKLSNITFLMVISSALSKHDHEHGIWDGSLFSGKKEGT